MEVVERGAVDLACSTESLLLVMPNVSNRNASNSALVESSERAGDDMRLGSDESARRTFCADTSVISPPP